MFQRAFCLFVCLILGLSAQAAEPEGLDDPLATLRAGHPRLMVLDDQLKSVQDMIRADSKGVGAAEAFRQVRAQADKMLNDPVPQHVLVGPRMGAQSSKALALISTCAGMYRLTGETKYLDRAKKELLTVSGFADWNPSHFLDVAEMTNACGIGYDWLYAQLSEDERRIIRQAIVEKGLNAALKGYEQKTFWTDCNMNWAQVCAGGITSGTLAIADEEPEMAKKVLKLTYHTMAYPMTQFAPDGGWDEGPGYWNYATRYNVYYLAAIESALGTQFDLDKMPGLSETALFHIQLTGPIGKSFNFADGGDTSGPAPQLFWLAKKFHRPEFAAWERNFSERNFSIFHLLWFDAEEPNWSNNLPLDAMFKRVNVGVMRSSWTDPNGWFVAFKGGDNAANHSHLDLGSFVLDALGQRWAMDFGSEDYNLPGYFGKQRYTYYRLSTRGHNTITFNGANQALKAKAPIVSFASHSDRSDAVIDLSKAYAGGNVRRGISLIDRDQVLVQDEIQFSQPEPRLYEWNFHTPAKVEVDGNRAVLTLNGVHLHAMLLSPKDGKFEVIDSSAPAPQKPNTGISDLVVRGNTTQQGDTITVLFSAIANPKLPALQSLENWSRH